MKTWAEVWDEERVTTCSRCNSEVWNNRYSLGVYAGRYCDDCWNKSGFRKEGPEGFDPMDAGESYEEVE